MSAECGGMSGGAKLVVTDARNRLGADAIEAADCSKPKSTNSLCGLEQAEACRVDLVI